MARKLNLMKPTSDELRVVSQDTPTVKPKIHKNVPPRYETDVSDEDIIQAMDKAYGIIPDVAAIVGLSTRYIRKRIACNPVLTEACTAARDNIVLVAESKLFQAIQQNDMRAIMFTLKCLGKHRGWTEDQTLTIRTSIDPTEAKKQVADIFALSQASDIEQIPEADAEVIN